MQGDISKLNDEHYAAWLKQFGGVDPDAVNEENFVGLVSRTLQTTDPKARARGLVEVANMALALADSELGVQVTTAPYLVLN